MFQNAAASVNMFEHAWHFSSKIALDSHAQLMMLIPLELLLLATATATAHASASANAATARLSVTFMIWLFFEIPRGPSACKSIPSSKPRDPQWAPCTN